MSTTPPKTTLNNYFNCPHLEQLLLWFLQNDAQIKLISSPTIKRLFQDGYRPASNRDNDPNILEEIARKNGESAGVDIIERWLVIRTWLDLIAAQNLAEKQNVTLEQAIKLCIDKLDEYGTGRLLIIGEILDRYGIDPLVSNLDNELAKIKTEEDKENFKYNYFADTVTAAEIRMLAWMYRDLFNKKYKLPKDEA